MAKDTETKVFDKISILTKPIQVKREVELLSVSPMTSPIQVRAQQKKRLLRITNRENETRQARKMWMSNFY